MSNNPKKVKITENGPYEVSGNIPLNQLRFIPDEEGASTGYEKIKEYPEQEKYSLCRCGHSHDAPYCDGTHEKVNFNGKETALHSEYRQMAGLIKGKQLDLLDAEELCAGARFCDTHGSTWNLITHGESQTEKDTAIQQSANCPSGRLTPISKTGVTIEPELKQEISTLEDRAAAKHGPLWIKGGITVEDSKGKQYPVRNRVTLCRCGKSENKPFCDGNHLR